MVLKIVIFGPVFFIINPQNRLCRIPLAFIENLKTLFQGKLQLTFFKFKSIKKKTVLSTFKKV